MRVKKSLQFIFSIIFLTGICFTVFNYLPLVEEETTGQDIEMNKKAGQEDTSGSDTETDSDGDDNNKSDLNTCSFNGLSNIKCSNYLFTTDNTNYLFLFAHTIIQPPKI